MIEKDQIYPRYIRTSTTLKDLGAPKQVEFQAGGFAARFFLYQYIIKSFCQIVAWCKKPYLLNSVNQITLKKWK